MTRDKYMALLDGADNGTEVAGILNAAAVDTDLSNDDVQAVHAAANYRMIGMHEVIL